MKISIKNDILKFKPENDLDVYNLSKFKNVDMCFNPDNKMEYLLITKENILKSLFDK